jgi:hypothetical protein
MLVTLLFQQQDKLGTCVYTIIYLGNKNVYKKFSNNLGSKYVLVIIFNNYYNCFSLMNVCIV